MFWSDKLRCYGNYKCAGALLKSINKEILHMNLCNPMLPNAIYALAKYAARPPRQVAQLNINTLITAQT